jgi:D-glycero-D-manno-heptose 1,7-bisphosphate phosphatase
VRRPAVFLDRDGVLNRAFFRDGVPRPPASLEALEILPSVPAALSALKSHGYGLVVVTNQPDVARGTATRALVESIHEYLLAHLQLDAILTCFHDSADHCRCRKPKPGMLLQAAHDFAIDLSSSFMVGDRPGDVEAGRRAGCRTIFVDCGYREAAPPACDYRVASLGEAAAIIVSRAPAP